MQHILLLDNYDSFTFNLEHLLVSLGARVDVIRNDEEIEDLFVYDRIVLSPGPGLPQDSKQMFMILESVKGEIPILGVCLGMQAIALYLNGELYNQPIVKHGVTEKVCLNQSQLYQGIPKEIEVGLYHSWAIREEVGDFIVTGVSEQNVIMSLENVELKMYGVQFHPESVMTSYGAEILANFLQVIG